MLSTSIIVALKIYHVNQVIICSSLIGLMRRLLLRESSVIGGRLRKFIIVVKGNQVYFVCIGDILVLRMSSHNLGHFSF